MILLAHVVLLFPKCECGTWEHVKSSTTGLVFTTTPRCPLTPDNLTWWWLLFCFLSEKPHLIVVGNIPAIHFLVSVAAISAVRPWYVLLLSLNLFNSSQSIPRSASPHNPCLWRSWQRFCNLWPLLVSSATYNYSCWPRTCWNPDYNKFLPLESLPTVSPQMFLGHLYSVYSVVQKIRVDPSYYVF